MQSYRLSLRCSKYNVDCMVLGVDGTRHDLSKEEEDAWIIIHASSSSLDKSCLVPSTPSTIQSTLYLEHRLLYEQCISTTLEYDTIEAFSGRNRQVPFLKNRENASSKFPKFSST